MHPGDIALVDCSLVDPPHAKFVVMLCAEPKPIFAFVNSQVSRFIRQKPTLLKCQVQMSTEFYEFLDHNSYLDVSGAFTYDPAEFDAQIAADSDCSIGCCTPTTIQEVLAVVEITPTLSAVSKTSILKALSELLQEQG